MPCGSISTSVLRLLFSGDVGHFTPRSRPNTSASTALPRDGCLHGAGHGRALGGVLLLALGPPRSCPCDPCGSTGLETSLAPPAVVPSIPPLPLLPPLNPLNRRSASPSALFEARPRVPAGSGQALARDGPAASRAAEGRGLSFSSSGAFNSMCHFQTEVSGRQLPPGLALSREGSRGNVR